ncbi:MAG: CDP-alcohol phosphatidyltransferase family protein, partial [Verrucomicrobiota bacterium]|nr:CDP-alcohol phosphatidyltransferase family protein [Verrucomicrobiota bacterium]
MANRFRRVLILADESADWIVAGLRQLDRLSLSIDEFAVENKETSPVLVCISWKPRLDQSQRWTPTHERLTHVAFTTEVDGEPFDLVLNTRLFLYRHAMRQLIGASISSPEVKDSWENNFRPMESLPGAWEYITDGNQIDEIEKRFLRGSGKSQDGFVSRYLNRPISSVVSRLLLRFPTTPNAWTLATFPIPVIASLVLSHGTYGSFVWALVLFQVFSILDGCDGEIARAKFMESERGRKLDALFDVLSNILLVLGLGFGLRHAHPRFGWFYLAEGIVAGLLIAINEWYLARRKPALAEETTADSLGGALYPRHRDLVQRSGLLRFGEKFASLVVQLTKRDVAVLFFLFLAVAGLPSLILHLLLV